jgi:glucosamine--fructose-6-phosphate aminotransferase (isomerizing)
MNPELFAADLQRKPEALQNLAGHLRVGSPWSLIPLGGRLVFVGMGSSHFANAVCAARLQACGIPAVAVLASTDLLPAVSATDTVVVVSASGTSKETLSAAQHYSGRCTTVALTNTDASPIADCCDVHIPLHAEQEVGGVACRTFLHTLVLLLALQEHLMSGRKTADETADLSELSVHAISDLLETRHTWLDPASDLLLGPAGTSIVAPARRLSSAQQSALMLREGPRLPAIACETGDWSHIDVYLTKTTDYRMLLLAGSQWEPELLDWCQQRGSTIVAAGGEVPGARATIRYRHDEYDDVRLLAETTIAELIAAKAWLGA